MNALKSIAGLAALALALAGCGKPDPQLVAQQMTMTEATCAPAEVAKIGETDVRQAFQQRCDRREQFKPPASPN